MRRTIIVFVIIATGLLAAACTQPPGGAGESPGAPAAPADSAPAAPASPEPVKPGY